MTVNNQVAEASVKYLAEVVGQVVPAGYKQTEVGVIPADWELSTIGNYTTWMSGGTPSRSNEEFWNGSIPWISGSTLKSFEISTSDQFLSEAAVIAGSKMAPVGAVLVLVRGSALHNTIRAGMVVESVAFNQDVKALVPIKGLDARFLTFFILGMESELLKLVSSAGNSAGVLDTELIKNFRLFLPSQQEQIVIANALSDIDALINELEKLIAKKQAIKTATMQQLLTGRTRLTQFALREEGTPKGYKPSEIGEIPEDWKVCELQEAVDFLDGLRKPIKSGDRAKISGIYPYFGASGIVDFVNDYLFDEDLILLGEDGENILSRNLPLAFRVSGKIWVNNHAHVLKPKDNFNIGYLTEFLESLDYSLLNSGTAQPKLNKQTCLKIKVAKPTIEEQTVIATILSDMDAAIQTLQQRLSKTRQIKQGMMQELLTGKTRLVKSAQKELANV